MSKDLINKAKELGIENAEALTPKQLEKAVKTAQDKLDASAELKAKAESLGLETEGKSDDELAEAITEAESKLEALKVLREKATVLGIDHDNLSDENLEIIVAYVEKFNAMANDEAREAELSQMLSEFLGVDDVYSLSKEEINALLDKKVTEEASGVEVVLEKSKDGKTDQSFTLNGKEYVFAEDAPAAFRYLGQRRTQKEWIEDSDALELMVAGKLSFITLKK